MESLLQNLTSVYWWLGVVIVGVLVNLASAYLKPKIDSFLASKSARRRIALEKKQQNRIEAIQRLKTSGDERIRVNFSLLRKEIAATRILIYGTLAFVAAMSFQQSLYSLPGQRGPLTLELLPTITSTACYVFAVFVLLTTLFALREAWNLRDLLDEAENEREKEAHGHDDP